MSVGRQEDFEFGPLTDSDFTGISELITRMSSADAGQRLRDKSEAYYRWMYEANPAGRAIVHSGRRAGAVVSSFAVAPKLFQVNGQEVLLGKTMDMFTDPDCQGRGLIKKCTDAVFKEATESGIEGLYVTPSVNSYPIFKGKWGYREDLQLSYRSRILDYSAVLGVIVRPVRLRRVVEAVVSTLSSAAAAVLRRRSTTLLDGYEAKLITHFGPEEDSLWTRIASGYRVAIIRDARYLNWRYVDNPDSYLTYGLTKGNALTGLIVLRTTMRRGISVGEIVDYLCPAGDQEILNRLVDVALDEFRRKGCAIAQAWSINGTSGDRSLRRAGLTLRRTAVKFLLSPGLTEPALYDPNAWFLTQGDGNDV